MFAPHWFPGFRPIAPLFAALCGLLLTAGMAVAQDPPSRVGRLSDVGGSVFLAPDDTDSGWQPVGVNYPVTLGDNLWVSSDGRAEIDFGAGQIRLANEANVHFSQLDDRQFSAFLAGGRAILRLRAIEPGETAKLDTPNAQIDILRPGTYRLDTSPDGTRTTLIVRDGEAELRVGERATRVFAGQTAAIEGNGYGAAMMVRDGYGTDGFDQYSLDRDRRIESAGRSSQYVSTYVPGVADLDAYGTWEQAPTYGAVWYPQTVVADWVPYRDGQWAYVRPWGWTWVDNAPWGWAPFHYGRWVRVGPRWAWWPGEYQRRPVYAPALVAWYGGPEGTSWSAGFGGPTFGWVPLAWGEPYWPQYRHSTEYWRRTNAPVAVDVRRMSSRPPQRYQYVNARIPGAVTAVSSEVMTSRRPVGPNHYTVPAQTLAREAITTAPLAVRPTTRPLTIDKMPPRAPQPASTFSARARPEYRGPGAVDGQPYPGTTSGRPFSTSPVPGQMPVPGAGGRGTVDPSNLGNRAPTRDPAPTVNDPRAVGGQVYAPASRPQPSPRQPTFDAAPGQPPTVNRPLVREGAPYNPGLNTAPQAIPAPPPSRQQVYVPQPPAPPPQPMYVPQQRPQPQMPLQRLPAPQAAPAPIPVAPAPSSIAPAQQSIAPAPAPTRAVPPQQPQGRGQIDIPGGAPSPGPVGR